MTPARWPILIPVKSSSRGKSRLLLPDEQRRQLATAIALDTISAAAEVGEVTVIVEDQTDRLTLGSVPGVRTHLTSARELNAAILDGFSHLGGQEPIVVLLGDLPGLRAADLNEALSAAGDIDWGVMSDRHGTGTTMLTATARGWRPFFGPDSYARHLAAGAVGLPAKAGSSLHLDVDVLADLDLSQAGVNTARLLRSMALR